MGQPRRPPLPAPPRRHYPVGALRPAAIARGREIVANGGAEALTLRGLARDLGVSAPALLYYFGSREGLREAVAESVHAELDALTRPPPAIGRAREDSEDIGTRWIAFAEQHPNLYRLAFGEGWRRPGLGWRPSVRAARAPTDPLEYKLRRALDRDRRSRHLPKDAPTELSRYVAAGIHGLATARLDGVDAQVVRKSLTMLVAAVPLSQWAWMHDR